MLSKLTLSVLAVGAGCIGWIVAGALAGKTVQTENPSAAFRRTRMQMPSRSPDVDGVALYHRLDDDGLTIMEHGEDRLVVRCTPDGLTRMALVVREGDTLAARQIGVVPTKDSFSVRPCAQDARRAAHSSIEQPAAPGVFAVVFLLGPGDALDIADCGSVAFDGPAGTKTLPIGPATSEAIRWMVMHGSDAGNEEARARYDFGGA